MFLPSLLVAGTWNCKSDTFRTWVKKVSLARCLDRIVIDDRYGRSALHIACEGGLIDIVHRLLDHPETDVNKPDAASRLPLHYACEGVSLEIVDQTFRHIITLCPALASIREGRDPEIFNIGRDSILWKGDKPGKALMKEFFHTCYEEFDKLSGEDVGFSFYKRC